MNRMLVKFLLTTAASAGLFGAAAPAKADHFSFGIGVRDCRPEVRRVWVEPVYEERCRRVWVEPIYETRTVPVFVNGYWNTVCDRTFVEPVYEYRDVVRFDHCGRRIVTRERICVREGGWRNVERREWVPEHYRHETQQVLVAPGHWEERRERICVREGHWETVAVGERGSGGIALNFGFRGR